MKLCSKKDHSFSFPQGVHPPEQKLTAQNPICRIPFSPYLLLILNQNAGKPSKSLVIEGQEVKRGQVVASAQGFISSPLHSPVDGVVVKVSHSLDFNGLMAPSIIIKTQPFSPQRQDVFPVDYKSLNAEQLVNRIQQMGMVGLGGAAFPTHVKLRPPKGKKIETLLLNGCECEPFLTSDHRVMVEQIDDLLLGIDILVRATKANNVVIGIEDNKRDAFKRLKERLSVFKQQRQACPNEPKIQIHLLKTKYPQGAEKILIHSLLKKEVPSGCLPIDIGVVVCNVATVAEIGCLMPKGWGLVERVVTVTGGGIDKPGNYIVPIGTPLNFLLSYLGMSSSACRVVFGGPMMGKVVNYLETPITKGVSGIVVLTQEDFEYEKKIYSCIRCARCVDVCPMSLNPSRLGLLAKIKNYDEMESYHLWDCFECGSCSYICPAHIPLVQYFKMAKSFLRKKKNKFNLKTELIKSKGEKE